MLSRLCWLCCDRGGEAHLQGHMSQVRARTLFQQSNIKTHNIHTHNPTRQLQLPPEPAKFHSFRLIHAFHPSSLSTQAPARSHHRAALTWHSWQPATRVPSPCLLHEPGAAALPRCPSLRLCRGSAASARRSHRRRRGQAALTCSGCESLQPTCVAALTWRLCLCPAVTVPGGAHVVWTALESQAKSVPRLPMD
jgi:hypothetical protein